MEDEGPRAARGVTLLQNHTVTPGAGRSSPGLVFLFFQRFRRPGGAPLYAYTSGKTRLLTLI